MSKDTRSLCANRPGPSRDSCVRLFQTGWSLSKDHTAPRIADVNASGSPLSAPRACRNIRQLREGCVNLIRLRRFQRRLCRVSPTTPTIVIGTPGPPTNLKERPIGFSLPPSPGHGFVDHGDTRRASGITAFNAASTSDGNLHRFKVIRIDAIPFGLRFLAFFGLRPVHQYEGRATDVAAEGYRHRDAYGLHSRHRANPLTTSR